MGTKRKAYMTATADIFLLFLMGAAAGWLYEVLLHLFQAGSFVNRGMLHGPWLPIYGTGCLMMVGLKQIIGSKPVRYFAACVAASAVLEYAASWGMEMIYHTRWWDYSDLPLNLNGRIFAGGLIGFGLAGCLFVYLVFPMLKQWRHKVPVPVRIALAALLAIIFAIDAFAALAFPNTGFGITHP